MTAESAWNRDQIHKTIEELRARIGHGAARSEPWDGPVLVVAGACSGEWDTARVRACLADALDRRGGTVISGGTVAGVPGLVGDVSAALAGRGDKRFHLVGYVPQQQPADVARDERYDEIIQTSGTDFSPQEPRQMWTDLLTGGVAPADVKVLGFGGGKISGLEYRLALALGATVGAVDCDGRAVADLLADPEWNSDQHLLPLPFEAETVAAFAAQPASDLDAEALERAAEGVHERYRADKNHSETDPAMQPWSKLREDLKESNRDQIRHAECTLRRGGFALRQAEGQASPVAFTLEEVEVMARVEHGRWNAERLAAGWRFAPERDAAAKTSPYLVPWSDLPDDIREYDRQAVRDLPRLFAEAGLEVYRL